MDRFDTMLAFTRVVELGSFTQAALSLNLPKTTVSAQVLALEKRLNVKLLHRTTRRISVTQEGAAYYERAVLILQGVEEAEGLLLADAVAVKGRLRVDVPTPLGRLVLVPALPLFMDRYPKLQLEIGCDDRTIDLLAEGVDCVIRVGQLADSSLVARPVGAMCTVFVASPHYLNAQGIPQVAEDLKQHQGIHFFSSKTGKLRNFSLVHKGQVQEITAQRRLAINNGEAIVAAALAGIGVCQLPTFMVQPYLTRGELVRLLPDSPAEIFPINALYPQNRHLSSKVRVFVDWVAEVFTKCPSLNMRQGAQFARNP